MVTDARHQNGKRKAPANTAGPAEPIYDSRNQDWPEGESASLAPKPDQSCPDPQISFWATIALLLAFLILGTFVLALIYGLPFPK